MFQSVAHWGKRVLVALHHTANVSKKQKRGGARGGGAAERVVQWYYLSVRQTKSR